MTGKPLVTIVVPVYNVEPYLRRCLDSILAQTFADYEVYCIDDASPDNSHVILCEYERKDARFHVIKNRKNEGLSFSRNVGLRYARGTYVYFF